jgi:polyribonucleotide nucleotidyltransferase
VLHRFARGLDLRLLTDTSSGDGCTQILVDIQQSMRSVVSDSHLNPTARDRMGRRSLPPHSRFLSTVGEGPCLFVASVRKSIAPGAVITGRVTSVRDFGAFVDLGGGVQGHLHVSEMWWSRVTDTPRGIAARYTLAAL